MANVRNYYVGVGQILKYYTIKGQRNKNTNLRARKRIVVTYV